MQKHVLIAAGSFVAATLVGARDARAGVFLGAELDGGAGFEMPANTHVGYGFLASLGFRIPLGPLFLQPEAQGGYQVFPGATVPPHAARVVGGVHLGLRGIFQPQIFGHAGVGWLSSEVDGPALDAGIGLAFKLVPLFTFGAQGAYNVVLDLSDHAATRWLSFGLHAGLEF
jgi:hypothetical protein